MENSESKVLGLGLSVIMLNIGMYLGVSDMIVSGIKKRNSKNQIWFDNVFWNTVDHKTLNHIIKPPNQSKTKWFWCDLHTGTIVKGAFFTQNHTKTKKK